MQRTALLVAALLCVLALRRRHRECRRDAPDAHGARDGLVTKGPSLTVTYVLAETAGGLPVVTLTPASGTARTFPQADGAAGEHSVTLDLAARGHRRRHVRREGRLRGPDGRSAGERHRHGRHRPQHAGARAQPTPAGSGMPQRPAPARRDRRRSAITGARIVTKTFRAAHPSRARFRLSEAATVSFLLQRGRGKRWVRLSSSSNAPAGDAFIRLPRGLRKGGHRLTIRATDAAGNRSPRCGSASGCADARGRPGAVPVRRDVGEPVVQLGAQIVGVVLDVLAALARVRRSRRRGDPARPARPISFQRRDTAS